MSDFPAVVNGVPVVWPWAVGSLLIAFPLLVVMPPLVMLLLIVSALLGTNRSNRGVARRSQAIAIGLLPPAALFVVLVIVHL